MSQDLQLGHRCPHLILEEVVAIGSDRKTLTPKAPIASATVVRVLANDEVYIPPGGLFSQAQITGSVQEPYRIQVCDTSFTVQSSTEIATVTVPSGARVTASSIVKLLQNALTDVAVEVINGHLVLTDTAKIGPESSLIVSGSAANALGFDLQRGARGKRIYPGWGLASLASITGRFIKFVDPIKQNPFFKVAYVADAVHCPRCSATHVENDYRFNLQGEEVFIQDENLLYQAALKILLTRIRSNPYHPGYGSAITSRIGAKAIGATASLITGDVQQALSNMQSLQIAQSKFQAVSAKERLYAVSSVRVTPSPDDATMFLVDVVVRNASGDPVAISIVFTVPGVAALSGTNGLSLGLESTGLSSLR